MDVVVGLNNYGCSMYSLERLDESQHLFSSALRALHLSRELEGMKGLDVADVLSLDPDLQRAFCIVKDWEHFPTRSLEATKRQKRNLAERQPATAGTADALALYIRSEPLRIEPSSSEVQDTHLMAATLLFNNALLCQRCWSARIASNHSLEQSVSLYSMAAQALLVEEHHFSRSVETIRRSELLEISILNNSGYAFYQMQQYDSSRSCFGTLEGRLLRMGAPLSSHEQDFRMRLAINVFVFFHCGETPTAAAA